MNREISKKGLICGAFIAFLAILKYKLEYHYRNELIFNIGISFLFYLTQFALPIILAYTFWTSLRKESFFRKFFFGIITFTFSNFLILSSNLVLHQYIDKDYRNIYTQQIIEHAKNNIELYPSLHSSSQAKETDLLLLKELTLNSFETQNQIYKFISIFPYIILLGLAISLSIFKTNQESKLIKAS